MINPVKIQVYKETFVSNLITEKTSILSEGKQFTAGSINKSSLTLLCPKDYSLLHVFLSGLSLNPSWH